MCGCADMCIRDRFFDNTATVEGVKIQHTRIVPIKMCAHRKTVNFHREITIMVLFQQKARGIVIKTSRRGAIQNKTALQMGAQEQSNGAVLERQLCDRWLVQSLGIQHYRESLRRNVTFKGNPIKRQHTACTYSSNDAILNTRVRVADAIAILHFFFLSPHALFI